VNLIVTGRNVDVTDRMEEYIEKKVGKLARHLPQLDEVRAELSYTDTRSADDRYTCQLTIWDSRRILRAEVSTGDIFASIDAGVEKLSRQIERVEGRRKKRRRASVAANMEAVMAATAPPEEQSDEGNNTGQGHIVRRKRFVMQPMNEEEAQEQMELLGHDFFLFFNPDENAVNLIYRRRDGDFGLLQPELA